MCSLNLSSEAAKYLAFSYRNITTIRRNIFQITEVLYFPFITMFSIGLMLSYLKPGPASYGVILSGVAALSVLQTCQLDVAYVLLFDMWSKSLKHTLVAPISRRHYIIGSWFVGIIRGTATFFILVFCVRWLFKFDMMQVGALPVIKFWAGMMVSGLLIGMITTIALYTFGWRAEIVPWSVVSVIMLLCGIYYPVSVLAPPLRVISNAIPITLFLESYRAAFGVPATPHASARGFALCIVYFFAIYFFLALAEKRAKRRGMILKLSE
jgi:ABC-2 type transport system permease protein